MRPALPVRVEVGGAGGAGPGAIPRMLRTERLTLRPLLASDRSEFLRVLRLSRKYLDEFCPLSNRAPHEPVQADEEIFEHQLALSEGAVRTGRAWRSVAFDQDGRFIGAFNINDIARGLEHSGELVLWLSVDALRRGYAAEGAAATIEHALGDLPGGLGLQRVSSLIAPGNMACRKLASRVGFRLSPTHAPVMLEVRGRSVSHDVFEVYAAVGTPEPTAGQGGGVVEAKPSVAQSILGRGLLNILNTEATEHRSS